MIIELAGSGRAAIRSDEASAAYEGIHVVRSTKPAAPELAGPLRTVAELSRAMGGMTMRALLGARYTPDSTSTTTVFEVPFGEPLGLGAATGCQSELGPPLVAGLPSDFADAALAGLAGDEDLLLPPGLVRVDRAGFDEVGSSEQAFRLVGDLLRHVLDALLRGAEPAPVARTVVGGW